VGRAVLVTGVAADLPIFLHDRLADGFRASTASTDRMSRQAGFYRESPCFAREGTAILEAEVAPRWSTLAPLTANMLHHSHIGNFDFSGMPKARHYENVEKVEKDGYD